MFQSDNYEMLTHDYLTTINGCHNKGSVHTNDNIYFNILIKIYSMGVMVSWN